MNRRRSFIVRCALLGTGYYFIPSTLVSRQNQLDPDLLEHIASFKASLNRSMPDLPELVDKTAHIKKIIRFDRQRDDYVFQFINELNNTLIFRKINGTQSIIVK